MHSAIGLVTPHDKLAGREREIWRERDRKLELAREQRRARRHQERLAFNLGVAFSLNHYRLDVGPVLGADLLLLPIEPAGDRNQYDMPGRHGVIVAFVESARPERGA